MYKHFKPNAGEHVLVLWSADLAGEASKDPWSNVYSKPGVLSADDASRLDFVKAMGARDYTVTAVFDGRSKSWRKHLEEKHGGSESLAC